MHLVCVCVCVAYCSPTVWERERDCALRTYQLLVLVRNLVSQGTDEKRSIIVTFDIVRGSQNEDTGMSIYHVNSLVHIISSNFSAKWNHYFIHDWPRVHATRTNIWCSIHPIAVRQTRPIRPQCHTALCGSSVPEHPGAFSFWMFFLGGRGKLQLGDWFESVIWFIVPAVEFEPWNRF